MTTTTFSFSLALQVLIIMSCFSCFMLLCWDQLTVYWSKKISLSQSLEPRNKRAFPPVVICPMTPFKVRVARMSEVLYNYEEYMRDATKLTVRFMGKVYTDYVFIKEKDFKTWNLFTYYHGVCRVFKVNLEFETNEFMAFVVDQDAQVAFMEEGEEFYLRTAEFLHPVTMSPVRSSVMLKVQPKAFVSYPRSGLCRDYPVVEFNQCLIDLFLEENRGNVCSDLTSKRYFPGLELCQPTGFNTTVDSITQKSADDNGVKYFGEKNKVHAITMAGNVLARSFRGDAGDCLRPCRTNTFELESVPLLHMDEESLGGHVIYVGFSSMFNVVSSEYLIYSFVDIVAAIGGGLGLFLGVSLLQLLYGAFDYGTYLWNKKMGKEEQQTQQPHELTQVSPVQ